MKYIEHEKALKALCADCCANDSEKYCDKENNPCQDYYNIKRVPTADVLPVVHGHWEYHLMPYVVKCSACHERIPVGKNEWNYCPNCGAKMKDGDGNV